MEKSLVTQTSEAITEWIIQSKFNPGHKLPNEMRLADAFKVGRGTLREAIRILISRNILEVKHGSGTYVSETFTLTSIEDELCLLTDLLELRYLIEPEVVVMASQHRTASQLEELEEIALQMLAAIENNCQRNVFKLEIKFHTLLTKMSGNVAMNYLIPVIKQSVTLLHKHYPNFNQELRLLESYQEVVEAIRQRNLMLARSSIQGQMIEIQRLLNLRQEQVI